MPRREAGKVKAVQWWESRDFHFGDDPDGVSGKYVWKKDGGSLYLLNTETAETHEPVGDYLPPGWVWGISLQNHLKPMSRSNNQVVLRLKLVDEDKPREVVRCQDVISAG